MTSITLHEALRGRRSSRDFGEGSLTRASLSRLLWAAQGVSDAAGRRTAPSAHGLHPLDMLVTAGKVEGLDQGLYEVGGRNQKLELVARGDKRAALETAALEEQPWIGEAAAIVTFCADREAVCAAFAEQPPKGKRGQRYLWIEAGAAAQNLQLQAVEEGLACVLVAGFQDEATAKALGLKPQCVPLLHLCLGPPAAN